MLFPSKENLQQLSFETFHNLKVLELEFCFRNELLEKNVFQNLNSREKLYVKVLANFIMLSQHDFDGLENLIELHLNNSPKLENGCFKNLTSLKNYHSLYHIQLIL